MSRSNPPISQEYLNAFVDGELAADERDLALERLRDDPGFKAAVCEAHALKAWVKGAYALPPEPARGRRPGGAGTLWWRAMAAGLLLATGLGVGWSLRDRVTDAPVFDRLAGLPEEYHPVAPAAHADPDRVVLHLDAGEPARMARALDVAERLLAARDDDARVQLVVNSYGLDLLRADVTPPDRALGQRIADLAARHANLGFVACGQTIARLEREGRRVELLPVAQTASSAIQEITTRMSEGWVYVRL